MASTYLAISQIATNEAMTERMVACTTQEQQLGNIPRINDDPINWISHNRYVWASSPGWAEAWVYAMDSHADDPIYDPGMDDGVITDGMILASVQHFGSSPEE